jgi:hypothetical protein
MITDLKEIDENQDTAAKEEAAQTKGKLRDRIKCFLLRNEQKACLDSSLSVKDNLLKETEKNSIRKIFTNFTCDSRQFLVKRFSSLVKNPCWVF